MRDGVPDGRAKLFLPIATSLIFKKEADRTIYNLRLKKKKSAVPNSIALGFLCTFLLGNFPKNPARIANGVFGDILCYNASRADNPVFADVHAGKDYRTCADLRDIADVHVLIVLQPPCPKLGIYRVAGGCDDNAWAEGSYMSPFIIFSYCVMFILNLTSPLFLREKGGFYYSYLFLSSLL